MTTSEGFNTTQSTTQLTKPYLKFVNRGLLFPILTKYKNIYINTFKLLKNLSKTRFSSSF
jgi:hypothetical protein